jgi:lauroyl/myristoyl acyltransferase
MLSLLRRLNVYGDVWLRFLYFGARICPWYLEAALVWGYTAFFFLFCGRARRSIAGNLRVICPGAGALTRWRGAFSVVHHFAGTLTDVAHQRAGHDVLDWEVTGHQHLEELKAVGGGALVLTAHMGNYDLAAPLLARWFKRRIHIVRAPERHAGSQRYMEEQRDAAHAEHFAVHYNQPGNMLAVELTHLLRGGEIVAIQGDRVLFDVSSEELAYRDDITWQLPRGPSALAVVADVPLIPIFIIRIGWRRYRIEIGEGVLFQSAPGQRQATQQAIARWWSGKLREVVERHPLQWFVFEPMFTRKPEVKSA